MFEFTLCGSSKTCLINNLYTKIKSHVEQMAGIIVQQKNGAEICVCLAVDLKYKDAIRQILADKISDSIISFYKFDFLEKHIDVHINNPTAHSAFIRALVVFDRETDDKIIKKNLSQDKKLNIDSFYHFRLWSLRDRWKEIALVVNDSIPTMLKNNSISDLTRYFVDSTQKEVSEIRLIAGKHTIQLVIDDILSDLQFDTTSNYIEDILTELISVSPQKIIIQGEVDGHKKLLEALEEVFCDNIFVIR